jgi:phosphoglycerate dehydrogenase-like enzyme
MTARRVRPVEVVVSRHAWQQFGTSFETVDDVHWQLVDPADVDASAHAHQAAHAPAEVVWVSNDMFFGPRFDVVVELMEGSAALRWVQSSAAGTDLPWCAPLRQRGVRLTTSHVTGIPIAEYVLSAVLNHYQEPHRWVSARARREWAHHDFREIAGTNWLVLGYGAIGVEIGRRATAFGARVIGVKRHIDTPTPPVLLVDPRSTGTWLPSSHVVVLCVPLTEETEGMVDARFLSLMRPDAVVVNVARGAVIDEAALCEALTDGTIEHAILDVATTEPPPDDSPLWDHPGITLTPHNAAGGLGRYRRAADVFIDNLRRYLDDRPLNDEVTEG